MDASDEELPVITSLDGLKAHVNKKVKVNGSISNTPWQHLMSPSATYPYDAYFDLPDGFQIVIYHKKPLQFKENQSITVLGTVIEIRSGCDKRQKIVDTGYVEYHINVDSIFSS
jgi:hypothetical protein